MENRFSVATFKGSNDVFGWNGCLIDNKTSKRYTLVNEVLVEEFYGQKTWMRCAFDTKADMVKAAQKMIRRLR